MDSRRETRGWRNCSVFSPYTPQKNSVRKCPMQHRTPELQPGSSDQSVFRPDRPELDGPAAQLGRRVSPGRGADHTPKVGASRTTSALLPHSHASSTPPSACTKVLTGGSSAGSWLPRGSFQTWTKRLGVQSHPNGDPEQAPNGSNSWLFHVKITDVRPQSLLMSVSALNLIGIDDSLSSRG